MKAKIIYKEKKIEKLYDYLLIIFYQLNEKVVSSVQEIDEKIPKPQN